MGQNKLMWIGNGFAKLLPYIQKKVATEEENFVFKMSDLCRIHDDRLGILLCVKVNYHIDFHAYCIRQRIEAHFLKLIWFKSKNGEQLIRNKINFFSYAKEKVITGACGINKSSSYISCAFTAFSLLSYTKLDILWSGNEHLHTNTISRSLQIDKTQYTSQWSIQTAVWEASRELLKCGCKEGCMPRNVSHKSAGIPCTLMYVKEE